MFTGRRFLKSWFVIAALGVISGDLGCDNNPVGHYYAEGGAGGEGGRGAGSGGGNAGASADLAQYDYVQLTAGPQYNCARLTDGTVKCWGQNGGWLGLGDYLDRGANPEDMGEALPTVSLGKNLLVDDVATREGTVCARLHNGTVKCWGSNSDGQLGQGDRQSRGGEAGQMGDPLTPIDLGDRGRVAELAVGGYHVCVRFEEGEVACWGSNDSGELGVGDTESRGDAAKEMGKALAEVALGNDRKPLMLAAGQRHTCTLLDNHRVKCWGQNHYGQLGVGDVNARGDEPDELGDNLDYVNLGEGLLARSIASGAAFSCAILEDRRVKCWGDNASGQLGNGETVNRGDSLPTMGDALPYTNLGSGFETKSLALGSDHACALSTVGTVKCWGRNDQGQLGQGNTEPLNVPPAKVLDFGKGRVVLSLSVGMLHSCVTLDNSNVKCWGANVTGQLGHGDTVNRGDDAGEMGKALPVTRLE